MPSPWDDPERELERAWSELDRVQSRVRDAAASYFLAGRDAPVLRLRYHRLLDEELLALRRVEAAEARLRERRRTADAERTGRGAFDDLSRRRPL